VAVAGLPGWLKRTARRLRSLAGGRDSLRSPSGPEYASDCARPGCVAEVARGSHGTSGGGLIAMRTGPARPPYGRVESNLVPLSDQAQTPGLNNRSEQKLARRQGPERLNF